MVDPEMAILAADHEADIPLLLLLLHIARHLLTCHAGKIRPAQDIQESAAMAAVEIQGFVVVDSWGHAVSSASVVVVGVEVEVHRGCRRWKVLKQIHCAHTGPIVVLQEEVLQIDLAVVDEDVLHVRRLVVAKQVLDLADVFEVLPSCVRCPQVPPICQVTQSAHQGACEFLLQHYLQKYQYMLV